jgi:type 2 lantibiotic biosynthesis protein LanM
MTLARALYLTERLPPRGTAGADAAGVEAWCAETGLLDPANLARRLRADGLELPAFQALVAAKHTPELPDPAAHRWLSTMDEALAAARGAPPAERNHVRSLAKGLSGVAWPVLLWAGREVRSRLDLSPGAVDGLLRALADVFAGRVSRTLILELNVARLRGELPGDTPEERFGSFVERFAALDRFEALLAEYPVLARLLAGIAGNWVDAVTEAVIRFHTDLPLLTERLGVPAGAIEEVEGTDGDPHRGGRTTLVLRCGNGSRVVYKPRPLAVDERFQELLGWLNDLGARPRFPVLRVLDRGDYGWQEFIAARDCGTVEEVGRFYRRQGGFLAVLYAVGASDFHRDNIIAAGEDPYLVDLETLFHEHGVPGEVDSAVELAYRTAKDSVLACGLLPFFVSGAEGPATTDVSGLGSAAGHLTPIEVLRWEGAGTDRMRAERGRIALPAGTHVPQVAGVAAHPGDHLDDLLAGFTDTYRLLAGHREELTEVQRRFGPVRTRYVLRPTVIYALAREGGYHPDYLRNALDRDRLFDRLWAGTAGLPASERIVPAECADLRADDIPYFWTRPDSPDLFDSRGTRISGHFAATGLSVAAARAARLGEDDLRRQLDFMHVTLETGERSHLRLPAGRMPDRDGYLAAAVEIGHRVADTAVRHRGTATWLEPSWSPGDRWQVGWSDIGLYSGLAGMALFLGHLGAVTGEDRFTTLTDETVRAIDYVLDRTPAEPPPSAFRGRAGFVYLLTHLSALRPGDPAPLDLAGRHAELLTPVPAGTPFDLLDGASGVVLVLLGLHRLGGDGRWLAAAREYGEHLVSGAEELPEGHGWRHPLAEEPLAGLSHGNAGVCWALSELAAATGEDRYAELAASGLRYERALLDTARGNWLDLRTEATKAAAGLPVAWCNGAAGIGLARLLCAEAAGYPHLDDDIDLAVTTTLREGFGLNECLCHGDFGNAELLFLAAERRGDATLRRQAVEHVERAFRAAHERGRWRTGWGRNSDEVFGLMNGLAGTGMALLGMVTDVPPPARLAPPGILR